MVHGHSVHPQACTVVDICKCVHNLQQHVSFIDTPLSHFHNGTKCYPIFSADINTALHAGFKSTDIQALFEENYIVYQYMRVGGALKFLLECINKNTICQVGR